MVTELNTYSGCKQCNESQRCVYVGDSYKRAASCKLPRLVTVSHEYGYKHLVVRSNIANSPRQKNHFFGLGENSLPFPLLLALTPVSSNLVLFNESKDLRWREMEGKPEFLSSYFCFLQFISPLRQ